MIKFQVFRPRSAQNGSKNYSFVIKYYQKLIHGFFTWNCSSITTWNWIKMIFLSRKNFWILLAKMGPKWSVSNFMKNQSVECFLFFEWSYSSIKTRNCLKWFIHKESCTRCFWAKIGPKSFLDFIVNWCIWFFLISAWRCSNIKAGIWGKLCWQNSYFGVYVTRRSKNWPKMRFFRLEQS